VKRGKEGNDWTLVVHQGIFFFWCEVGVESHELATTFFVFCKTMKQEALPIRSKGCQPVIWQYIPVMVSTDRAIDLVWEREQGR
jgi:hypothetical protein